MVWLPLTKDTRNQGLFNLPVPWDVRTRDTGGKLGQYCYSDNAIYHIENEWLGNEWSLACWVKSSRWGQYNDIILCKNTTDSDNAQFYLSIIGGAWLNIGCNSGSETLKINYTFATNTWYHVAATYDGVTLKLYLNGNEIGTKAYTSTQKIGMNNLGIGCRSTNTVGTSATGGLSKRMNDVRIYDHCLSPLEVKEISKGLVLHYPLSDAYVENTLNYLGEKSDTFTSWRSYGLGSKGTITIDTTQTSVCGGQVAKLANNTTETSNSTIEMATVFTSVASTVMQKNEKFTISAYVKGNGSTIGRHCYLHIYNTNGTNTSSTSGQPIVLTDKWQRIIYTYTWPYDAASSNSGNCYIYAPMKGGESIYICNVQIEKKDHATPFTNNSRTSNIIYDCSGFCNNGTISGVLTISNDTPKYEISTYMPKSALITHPRPVFGEIDQEWSCAMWVKLDVTSQANQYMNNFNGGNQIVYTANSYPLLYLNSGTNDYYMYGSQAVSAGVWTHITFVFKNSDGTRNIYINGVLKNRYGPNKTSTPLGIPDIVTIGTNLAGYISDYRIYATALSVDDVKSLYNNSAYIDNQGNIYGAVYEEV